MADGTDATRMEKGVILSMTLTVLWLGMKISTLESMVSETEAKFRNLQNKFLGSHCIPEMLAAPINLLPHWISTMAIIMVARIVLEPLGQFILSMKQMRMIRIINRWMASALRLVILVSSLVLLNLIGILIHSRILHLPTLLHRFGAIVASVAQKQKVQRDLASGRFRNGCLIGLRRMHFSILRLDHIQMLDEYRLLGERN